MKNIVLLSVLVFLASCGLFKSEKEDGETGILSKKKRQPVNVSERVMSTESDGFFSSNSQKHLWWKNAVSLEGLFFKIYAWKE